MACLSTCIYSPCYLLSVSIASMERVKNKINTRDVKTFVITRTCDKQMVSLLAAILTSI